MNSYEKWVLKDAANRAGLHRLLSFSSHDMPDELVAFANIMIQHERDKCSAARAPNNHKLAPCGTGAFLSDQQYCFDKGWKMGAAAVRKEISRRTGIDGKKK